MAGKTAMEQIGVDLPERPVVEETPAVEVSDRPEWLPEKFKDESEFAHAYKNLETELTRRGEETKDFQSKIDQLTAMVETLNEKENTPPPPATSADDVREQLQAAYERDPIGTIALMAQNYGSQAAEAKWNEYRSQVEPHTKQQADQANQLLAVAVDNMMNQRHEDWDEMKDVIRKEIDKDPYLLPQEVVQQGPEATARALERVYKTVKAERTLEQLEAGTLTTSTERMKIQAQGLTGVGGRPGQKSDSEQAADAIVKAAQGLSYSGWRSKA